MKWVIEKWKSFCYYLYLGEAGFELPQLTSHWPLR